VWDANTGQELLAKREQGRNIESVAFSPEGQRIVTGGNYGGKIWNASRGQVLLDQKGQTSGVRGVQWSPDGRSFVTVGLDGTATGKNLFTFKGHTKHLDSVAWSPDGKHIVTGSFDNTAKVWDAEIGQEVPTRYGIHRNLVSSVAFSPDGHRIVTGVAGQNATARLWDVATDRELLVLAGHTEPVTRVAFSDDGQMIFAWDQQKNLLAWSVASGEPVAPVDPPPEPLPGPARSQDGLHHAVPEGNNVVVSDTSPLPENAWPFPNRVQRIRYHADRATLANQQNQNFAAKFHLQQVKLAETELLQE